MGNWLLYTKATVVVFYLWPLLSACVNVCICPHILHVLCHLSLPLYTHTYTHGGSFDEVHGADFFILCQPSHNYRCWQNTIDIERTSKCSGSTFFFFFKQGLESITESPLFSCTHTYIYIYICVYICIHDNIIECTSTAWTTAPCCFCCGWDERGENLIYLLSNKKGWLLKLPSMLQIDGLSSLRSLSLWFFLSPS